jgi:hypothetical protein
MVSSCEQEGEFEPNNLISITEDEKAEEDLANASGAPYIISFTLNSSGTYDAGDKIIISATFSKKTRIDTPGTPRIPLDIGGVIRYASYTGGSGSVNRVFTFEYTIQLGDLDHNGVEMVSPWELNGSTVEDYADQQATLTFTPPGLTSYKVDTSSLTASFGSVIATSSGTPTVTLSAPSASTTYVGTSCLSGGSDVVYSTSTSASIYSLNTTNTFYVAVGNGTGGYSACKTITIIHDNQNPGVVSGVANSSNSSDIESDVATWSAASDIGPAGVSHYMVAVSTTNTIGGIIAAGSWSNVGANLFGSVSNGATPYLSVLTNYYSLIKAVDRAGNESSVVASPLWQLAALSPEQITSMSVVDATDSSIKVGWPYPNDNGFPITDYIIEYKLSASSTWTTIIDGTSTDRRYELAGLDPETNYDFRVRAFNGTNYGAWAPTVNAETLPTIDFISTPYSAINVGGATASQLVSLEDDNEIYYGTNSASSYNNGALISADLDRGKTVSVPSNDFTVVVATKPFFIAGRLAASNGDVNKANVVWQTSSWIGKEFLFNHNRYNPMKVKVYAFTDSDVTVTRGGAAVTSGTATLSAESGHVFSITTTGAYEIKSTGFIMVYGYANQGGNTYVDPRPLLPSSNDVIGVPSRDAKITTEVSNNGLVGYHSNNTQVTRTVQPGSTGNIDQTGTNGYYADNSLRIRSDSPIIATSYADRNGGCTAPFVPVAFQKTKFAINVQAEWVAMVSTNEVVVTAYEPTADGLGWETPRVYNMTRTGSNNNTPTKGYETNRNFRAGTIFEGTAPFQMYYEPSGNTNAADNDETIMFGWD